MVKLVEPVEELFKGLEETKELMETKVDKDVVEIEMVSGFISQNIKHLDIICYSGSNPDIVFVWVHRNHYNSHYALPQIPRELE